MSVLRVTSAGQIIPQARRLAFTYMTFLLIMFANKSHRNGTVNMYGYKMLHLFACTVSDLFHLLSVMILYELKDLLSLFILFLPLACL